MLPLVAILMLGLSAPAPDSAAVVDAVRVAVAQKARASVSDSVVVDILRLPGRLGSQNAAAGAPDCSAGAARTSAAQAVSYRVPSLPLGTLRGPIAVMVEVVRNNVVTARLPVSCLVRTFGTVLVASRHFDRHAPLEPAGLMSQRTETTRLPADIVPDTASLAGMWTKRIINPGTVICASLCETMPAVRQGDELTLLARRNGVKLTVQALAKQDGRPGAIILVQPIGAHERLRARVLDARSAEILAD